MGYYLCKIKFAIRKKDAFIIAIRQKNYGLADRLR